MAEHEEKGTGDAEMTLAGPGLRTPRAAAVAGILFSILLICCLVLLRVSLPVRPLEDATWLQTSSEKVTLALNLVPFAGVFFMWFLGVLRDRLGAREDKFFATVFLGSGLMFLGMLFVAAAAVGGLIRAYGAAPTSLLDGASFAFERAFAYDLMHIYAFKMAAVFMLSTSTLLIRTRAVARWIPVLGFVSAVSLLVGSGFFDWILLIFPLWVLLVSVVILIENLRQPRDIRQSHG